MTTKSPAFILPAPSLYKRPTSILHPSSHPLRPTPLRTYRVRASLDPEPTEPEKRVDVIPKPPVSPPAEKSPVEDKLEKPKEEQPVPGKFQLNELELAAQRRELEKYSDELRKQRIAEEREDARLFGFVDYAETLNGRLAMFFLVTGLLTEYWTGYNIPEQVELMARTLGIL